MLIFKSFFLCIYTRPLSPSPLLKCSELFQNQVDYIETNKKKRIGIHEYLVSTQRYIILIKFKTKFTFVFINRNNK